MISRFCSLYILLLATWLVHPARVVAQEKPTVEQRVVVIAVHKRRRAIRAKRWLKPNNVLTAGFTGFECVVNTLHAWAALPLAATTGSLELTLLDARVFTVAFRHSEAAVEAEPVKGFPARSESDFYRVTLRLMQI